MFGLKIFVRVQTFRRVPPVLPRNFCHPGEDGADEVDVGEVDGNYDDHVGRDEDDGDCLPQGPD